MLLNIVYPLFTLVIIGAVAYFVRKLVKKSHKQKGQQPNRGETFVDIGYN